MALDTTTNSVNYTGNASAVTAYSIPFRYDDTAALTVVHYEAGGTANVLTLGDDFTLTGSGPASTGELVTLVAIPATDSITIARNAPATQLLELIPNSPLPAADLEQALDRVVMPLQDLRRDNLRSLRVPLGETFGDLPKAAARANSVLEFDEDGNVSTTPTATSAASASASAASAAAALVSQTAASASAIQAAASAAGSDSSRLAIFAQVLLTASRALVASDMGKDLFQSVGGITITLPPSTNEDVLGGLAQITTLGTLSFAGNTVTNAITGTTVASVSGTLSKYILRATLDGWTIETLDRNTAVNEAIAENPAASRLAMGVHSTTEAPSNAQLDISLELAIDPAVRAYSSRALLTNRNGIIRLDAFKKGVDALGLTLNEAVFFGEGLNNQAAPISFVRMDAGTAGSGTFTAETHGLVGTVNSGNTIPGFWRFPISDLTDFTVCHFYSGDNTTQAYQQFVGLGDSSLATTGSYLRIMTADTSGNATAVAFKAGEASAAYALHSSYTTELVRMLASKWEDGVGVSSSHNGAAFGSQAAYAETISSSLEWLGVGGHTGNHIGSLVFDGLLTDTQIAEVRKLALRTIASSNIYAVLEGDSIMEGANEWFEMALRSDTWAGAVTGLANIATGGETAKHVYDQAVAGSFNTYKPTAANPRTWLFLQAGHNDLALHASSGDYTPAKVLEHLTETCRIAKAAGIEKTIVTTLLKGSGISGNGRLADVDTINAALLAGTAAGSQYIDDVVDMESAISTAAGGGTYWTNTTYFADGVHPNDTGRAIMAAELNASILPVRAAEEALA